MCIWVCDLSLDSIDQSYTEPPGIFLCGAIIFLIFIFYAPEVGKIILVYRPLIGHLLSPFWLILCLTTQQPLVHQHAKLQSSTIIIDDMTPLNLRVGVLSAESYHFHSIARERFLVVVTVFC